MHRTILQRTLLFLCCALLIPGCSLFDDDDSDSEGLAVTLLVGKASASPADPAVLTVIVENRSTFPLTWGVGSSTCQFHAVVRVGGIDREGSDDRICTDDIVDLRLLPGESRTESWGWDGRILGNQGYELLPPGMYTVYGAAGDLARSAPVEIEVVP